MAANFANCLYDWENQYDELKAFRYQNFKKLPDGGKKSIIVNYEKDIYIVY